MLAVGGHGRHKGSNIQPIVAVGSEANIQTGGVQVWCRQHPPQEKKRLAQTVKGRLARLVRPQQERQPFACMGTISFHRQIGQPRLCFLRWKSGHRHPGYRHLERAEQGNGEFCHRGYAFRD